jgi:hypothetical protein
MKKNEESEWLTVIFYIWKQKYIFLFWDAKLNDKHNKHFLGEFIFFLKHRQTNIG